MPRIVNPMDQFLVARPGQWKSLGQSTTEIREDPLDLVL
jgi:hypothetical protein